MGTHFPYPIACISCHCPPSGLTKHKAFAFLSFLLLWPGTSPSHLLSHLLHGLSSPLSPLPFSLYIMHFLPSESYCGDIPVWHSSTSCGDVPEHPQESWPRSLKRTTDMIVPIDLENRCPLKYQAWPPAAQGDDLHLSVVCAGQSRPRAQDMLKL